MEMVFDLKGKVARKVAKFQEMKKQRGVTLLEIIIVLGIIGIIAAGVVILAQRAFTAQDLTDVQDSLTSVRTAMDEAYKDSTEFPAATSNVTDLTKQNISSASTASDQPIATLVRLGKISPEEAFNGFSSDAFQMDQATTDSANSVHKGFVVLVNGLEQEECRNLISQMGNQWDYVEAINAGAGAGVNFTLTGRALDDTASGAILKTTTSTDIAPNAIVATGICDGNGAVNGVIFGSK